MLKKDLIIIALITIFLLITIASIYTVGLAIKLLPTVLIIFFILKYVGVFGEQENYEVNVNFNTSDYDQTTCLMNGNRPFIINSQDQDAFAGSTMHCVMKGGPINWKDPIWNLPISDPLNPAYYDQFPSQMLRLN
jgi:hypothetical protein